MILVLSEINCMFLKGRLIIGQNWIENRPLGTPEGADIQNSTKKGRKLKLWHIS